jgi:Arc/MetJ-type ribon-helix-helix transcriptional regulator
MSELFREGLRHLEQEEQQKLRGDLAGDLRLIRQSATDAGLNMMVPREINAEAQAGRRERMAKAGLRRRG